MANRFGSIYSLLEFKPQIKLTVSIKTTKKLITYFKEKYFSPVIFISLFLRFCPSQSSIHYLCCVTCFFLSRYAFITDSRSLFFTVFPLILIPSSVRMFEILLHVFLLSFRAQFFYVVVQSWGRFLFPNTFSVFWRMASFQFFLMELTLWIDTPNFRAIFLLFHARMLL